jgi:hypothetical protein
MTGDLAMADGKTVDGIDVGEIHQAKVKTGTYTGDGTDNRNIDIGVDLALKSNVYVIIKSLTSVAAAIHRIEYDQGDLTMGFLAWNDISDAIQAFTPTGFQVGTQTDVNHDAYTYRYIAFWEEP